MPTIRVAPKNANDARPQSPFARLLAWAGNCRFLTVSMLIHAILVLVLGSVVLSHVPEDAPDFVAGSEGGLVEPADPNAPPAAPELSQALPQEYVPPTPTVAAPPISALVTASEITPTFAVTNSPNPGVSDSLKSAMASISASRLGEGGGAGGLGGRIGGMAKINFFGVKTEAKHIAFLVDYSGSMEGPFRKRMEAELDKSLKGLPPGTQILVIPWAGGAWLYNQLATEISDRWQEIGGQYDNFAIRAGKKLDKPEWMPVNPDNIVKLMKGINAQKSWPGGTDWRSPFRYAMEANPPPDTIFFLTDGQIQDTERAFSAIDAAMKKAARTPTVFALYIPNKAYGPGPMKTLAEKYHGEFHELK